MRCSGNSTYRQRDCDGGVCDIYVALHIIPLLSEFFTVIYIFSCPWQEITIAPANRHASASACFGHNATALLPHCANTSARRLTAPALTNIWERGLNLVLCTRVRTCAYINLCIIFCRLPKNYYLCTRKQAKTLLCVRPWRIFSTLTFFVISHVRRNST